MNTINSGIPYVPENTIDPAAGLNQALSVIDALLQVRVISVGSNTPPASPVEGSRYVVGTAPSGAWATQANKLAAFYNGGWQFYSAALVVNLADNKLWINGATGWAAAI